MGLSRTVAWRGGVLAGVCGLVLSLAAGVGDAVATFEQTRANLRLLAEVSRTSIGVALYNLDDNALRQHVEGLLAYPGVARVELIDDQLSNVAIDRRKTGERRDLHLPIPAEAVTVTLNEGLSSGRGRLILHRDPGYVEDRLVDQFFRSVAIALGEAVIVLGALLLLMRRLVVAPVEQLTELAKQMENGVRPAEAFSESARQDEIGTLSKALIGMADRLLEDALMLEQRVDERTRELAESRSQLIESEKMAALGSLVAGVAHEVNTPLGASVTLGSALKDRFARLLAQVADGTMTRENLREFLEKGEANMAHLNDNLSRAASLIASFKMIAVDETADVRREIKLRSYLEQILGSLGAQTRRGKLDVSIDCPPELEWSTWPGALAQLVTNMVINAIIHAYDGAGGALLIRAERLPEGIALHFIDHGAGIAAEHLPHIWEPFWTTRRGKEGSGLGLSIVYNIVTQRLAGQVAISSKPNEGAHFRFNFPLPRERVSDD